MRGFIWTLGRGGPLADWSVQEGKAIRREHQTGDLQEQGRPGLQEGAVSQMLLRIWI